MLQSLGPLLASLMVLAALAILWRRSRSVWLIVALVAEIAALAFRSVVIAFPDLTHGAPLFFALWMLCSLVFAAGLLGYALEMNQRPER